MVIGEIMQYIGIDDMLGYTWSDIYCLIFNLIITLDIQD